MGVVPLHCALVAHCTQAPLLQCRPVPHSPSLVQPRQVLPLQMDADALLQSAFVAHCTHAPIPAQIGSAPLVSVPHSVFEAQARQAPVAVLQNGAVPAQPVSDVQVTHSPCSVPL